MGAKMTRLKRYKLPQQFFCAGLQNNSAKTQSMGIFCELYCFSVIDRANEPALEAWRASGVFGSSSPSLLSAHF
jgi:hypothetical protein